jgi:GNAT superfamily N-acetyltransferase
VGIGELVMDALVAWAQDHGCEAIDAVALPGDRETKNFFERFGLTARAIVVHRRLDAAP